MHRELTGLHLAASSGSRAGFLLGLAERWTLGTVLGGSWCRSLTTSRRGSFKAETSLVASRLGLLGSRSGSRLGSLAPLSSDHHLARGSGSDSRLGRVWSPATRLGLDLELPRSSSDGDGGRLLDARSSVSCSARYGRKGGVGPGAALQLCLGRACEGAWLVQSVQEHCVVWGGQLVMHLRRPCMAWQKVRSPAILNALNERSCPHARGKLVHEHLDLTDADVSHLRAAVTPARQLA